MAVYDLLSKLTQFSNAVLYTISPSSRQYLNPSDTGNMLINLNECIQTYKKYLSPNNLLPPYNGNVILTL